jgi:hypothetical protein
MGMGPGDGPADRAPRARNLAARGAGGCGNILRMMRRLWEWRGGARARALPGPSVESSESSPTSTKSLSLPSSSVTGGLDVPYPPSVKGGLGKGGGSLLARLEGRAAGKVILQLVI